MPESGSSGFGADASAERCCIHTWCDGEVKRRGKDL